MTIVDSQGREHVISQQSGETTVAEVPRAVLDHLLAITAERDALRDRVEELERRVAELTRAVVAAEVEDA